MASHWETDTGGSQALARIGQAARLLAEARNLTDIQAIRNMAAAAEAYATAARLGSEAVNHAAEIKLLAERKAGELLRTMPKQNGGDAKRATALHNTVLASGAPPTLADLGITPIQSSRWQALARVDDATFSELVEEAKAEGSVSTGALVSKVRSHEARERYAARPGPLPAGPLPDRVRLEQATALDLPLPDGSIQLQVTSPPYGLGKAYAATPDDPDDWMAFTRAWLQEAYRVAATSGRLALNVPLDTTTGGLRPTYAQAVAAAELAGWTYRFTVVWWEGNVSRSTARGTDSPSAPHVMAPVEMLPVFVKGQWSRTPQATPDLTHEEWLSWTSGLWTFGGETRPWEGHPAAFPLELPRRLIKLLSFPGDTVLDQFCGSGTTVQAAAELGRYGVGFDVAEAYIEGARRRLANLGGGPDAND